MSEKIPQPIGLIIAGIFVPTPLDFDNDANAGVNFRNQLLVALSSKDRAIDPKTLENIAKTLLKGGIDYNRFSADDRNKIQHVAQLIEEAGQNPDVSSGAVVPDPATSKSPVPRAKRVVTAPLKPSSGSPVPIAPVAPTSPPAPVTPAVAPTGAPVTLESVDFKKGISPENLNGLLLSLDTLVKGNKKLRSETGLSDKQLLAQSPAFHASRFQIIRLRNRLEDLRDGVTVNVEEMMDIKKTLLDNLRALKTEIANLKIIPPTPPIPPAPVGVETEDVNSEYKFRFTRNPDGSLVKEDREKIYKDGTIRVGQNEGSKEDKTAPLDQPLSPEYLARKESRSAWQAKRKEYDELFEQKSHKWGGRFLGLNPRGFEKTKAELNQTKATYSTSLHDALVERSKKQQAHGVESRYKASVFDGTRTRSEVNQKLEIINTGYKPWFIQRFVIDDAKRRIEAQKSLLSEEKQMQIKELGEYLKKHKWKVRAGSILAVGIFAAGGAAVAGAGLAAAMSVGSGSALIKGKRMLVGAWIGGGVAAYAGGTTYKSFNDKVFAREQRLIGSEDTARSSSYERLLGNMDSLTDDYIGSYKDLEKARTQRKVATIAAAIGTGVIMGGGAYAGVDVLDHLSDARDTDTYDDAPVVPQVHASPAEVFDELYPLAQQTAESLAEATENLGVLIEEAIEKVDALIEVLQEEIDQMIPDSSTLPEENIDVQGGISEQIHTPDTGMVELPSLNRGAPEFVPHQHNVGTVTAESFNPDGTSNPDSLQRNTLPDVLSEVHAAPQLSSLQTESLTDIDTSVPRPPLGEYEIEGGDNFWNLAEGQTNAPQPYTFQEVPADTLQATIDLTRDYLNAHPEIARDIGFTVDGDVGKMYQGDPLDLDKLDAVVRSIATEQGFISPDVATAETLRPLARPEDLATSNLAPEESIRPQARPDGLVPSELAPSESTRSMSLPEGLGIVDPAILDTQLEAANALMTPETIDQIPDNVLAETFGRESFITSSYQDILGSDITLPESLKDQQLIELAQWAKENHITDLAQVETQFDVILQRDLLPAISLSDAYSLLNAEHNTQYFVEAMSKPIDGGSSWYEQVLQKNYGDATNLLNEESDLSFVLKPMIDELVEKIPGSRSMTVGEILERAITDGLVKVVDGKLVEATV